jgi:hypothetical protein
MMMKVWFLDIDVWSDGQETTYFKRVFKKLHAICRDKVQISHPSFTPLRIVDFCARMMAMCGHKVADRTLASAAGGASV